MSIESIKYSEIELQTTSKKAQASFYAKTSAESDFRKLRCPKNLPPDEAAKEKKKKEMETSD